MLKLARNYAARPSAEWRPLFYRILENAIRDQQRRAVCANASWYGFPARRRIRTMRRRIDRQRGRWWNARAGRLMQDEAMQNWNHRCASCRRGNVRHSRCAISRTRCRADASAMGCSEGSVKTHYSRAVHTLREQLGEVCDERRHGDRQCPARRASRELFQNSVAGLDMGTRSQLTQARHAALAARLRSSRPGSCACPVGIRAGCHLRRSARRGVVVRRS